MRPEGRYPDSLQHIDESESERIVRGNDGVVNAFFLSKIDYRVQVGRSYVDTDGVAGDPAVSGKREDHVD